MRDYHTLRVRPIDTGFLVSYEDQRYYDGNQSAFSTWEETVEFIKNNQPKFRIVDDSQAVATSING